MSDPSLSAGTRVSPWDAPSPRRGRRSRSRSRHHRSRHHQPSWAEQHAPELALAVYAAVAVPLLVWFGRTWWFLLDDWDFTSARRATNLGDLFRPHNSHWSTLPILVYRALFTAFGVRTYRPYQVPVLVAHLAVVALLWLVMRRSGVGPWVASLTAGLLVLFGAGSADIVWGFQIGFTGALAFGLAQLLLADHDGGIDWRDGLALLAGLAALMSSGVGVSTLVVVGVATLLRRGWRMAAVQTVPLVAVFGVWYVLEPSGALNPFHATGEHIASAVAHWDLDNATGTFHALGHGTAVGVALAVILFTGLAVSFVATSWPEFRRTSAKAVALLIGAVVFATISGVGRWELGLQQASASRYLYLSVAFVLPALAVAVDALIQRWRILAPVLVVALVLGVPGNIAAFDTGTPRPGYQAFDHVWLQALARSPEAGQVPASVEPDPGGHPYVTVGWLLEAERQHRLPSAPPTTTTQAATAAVELGAAVSTGPVPSPGQCTLITGPRQVHPARGTVMWAAGHYLQAQSFTLVALGPDQRHASAPVSYSLGPGERLTIWLPDMDLLVDPTGQPITLCH